MILNLLIVAKEPLTSPFTTQCLIVLILMSDRYNFMPIVTKTASKLLLNHKYPIPVLMNKNGEEILRQKILIQYYSDQGPRFTASTKDLIIRGSIRWSGIDDASTEFETPWWDMNHGLEGMGIIPKL
jgi:hypothetical protein